MSTQADEVNKFARKVLGDKADKAAASLNSSFTVLPGGSDGGGGEKKEEDKKNWVRLPTTNWLKSQFAREVGQIMSGEEMFSREGVAVLIDAKSGQINGITPQKAVTHLERWFVFYQLKVRDEQEQRLPMSMTVDTARFLMESEEFTGRLRQIDRVNKVRMPVVRNNGKVVLLNEGYDEESRIFTLKSGLTIDETMSLEKAIGVINHLLSEFPFEDARSRAVQVCLMVSLFGTCMLPLEASRMGFVVRSNDRGGGKSLLVEAAVALPFGLPATADIRDRNKLGEVLDSAALQSESYVFFDNLEGVVKNTLIDNFITAKARRVRLFHTQKTVDAVPGSMLLFTGNNLEVSPDIDRRTLLCRLFVEEFDLQERKIANVIDVNSLLKPAVRQELLGAMWALVRHWSEKGCPPAGGHTKPYRRASFKDWSDIFGGIVEMAGYGNPLLVPSDAMSAAPERVHQRRLVEMLTAKITPGEKRIVVREFSEIMDICFQQDLFPWKMEGKTYTDKNSVGEEKTVFQPSTACLAWLGKFMAGTVCGRETGREYTLPDKRRVKIGFNGSGRARTWFVEIVG